MKRSETNSAECFGSVVGSPEKSSGLRSLIFGFARVVAPLVRRFCVRAEAVQDLRGGGLLVGHEWSWEKAFWLQVSSPREIRFFVSREIPRVSREALYRWLLSPIVHEAEVAEGNQWLERAVRESIRTGAIVCFFGENERWPDSWLGRFFAEETFPVVPVWVDVFSLGGMGRALVSIAYGSARPASEVSAVGVREMLFEQREIAYRCHPALHQHLGREAIRGLSFRRSAVGLVDGLDGSVLSRGALLAAGIALSEVIRREFRGPRVAIVLPPGKGCVIANLAVVLAGKVPVNLNFTAGRPAIEAAQRIAELGCALTAKMFAEKIPEFPWPSRVLFLEKVLPALKPRMLFWGILTLVLPVDVIAWMLGLPKRGGREEAVILFTSGSSGDPKGVVLSHRNLLGNVAQFSAMLGFKSEIGLLSCLPIFHSFGSTVTLWYPILKGMRMVTYPSPMDPMKNAELIERYEIGMLFSTPTFLRGYLRKVEREQLKSLRLVVTGAERLPMDLAEAFLDRFGISVMQGYGLTETSPVASVNLPEREGGIGSGPFQRKGSVGLLAPGMAAQIRCADRGVKVSLEETGMLWLKGPNIFEGYLNDPDRSAEVLSEGWFKTGDLGRFDADGFLYIEGRVSRFSKIGGEMVPHETLEMHLMQILEVKEEEKVLAVAGVPDEAKGEALVVLTTRSFELSAVRAQLQARGLPNLWVPRRLVEVAEIPHLATGKMDLRRIREIAMGAS